MLIGLVKWFDTERGFGVVGNPEEGEFFLHINNFNGPQKVGKGTAVIFKKKVDVKKNRNLAENCRVLGSDDDWKIVMSYLGKPDNVTIEVEITGRGKRGNPYHRKENQSFSLMSSAAQQLFKEKTVNEVIETITNYFETDLNDEHFIDYCEFIEGIITKKFSSGESEVILTAIFNHFGNNLNEKKLFQAWKAKKFKYISRVGAEDYEIPKETLLFFKSEIGVPELKRIKGYSFGSDFCADIINSRFYNLIKLDSKGIVSLYPYLELMGVTEKKTRKAELDSLYARYFYDEIMERAKAFTDVKCDEDFNNFYRLMHLIPDQIGDEERIRIKDSLNRIMASKCVDEYKPELWIRGLADDALPKNILKTFLDAKATNEKRSIILSKLDLDRQFQFLKSLSEDGNFETAFDLLEHLVKQQNSLPYGFNLSENIFNTAFWQDKKCNDLVQLFTEYTSVASDGQVRYRLFLEGFIKEAPENILMQNISNLDEEDCRKIFRNPSVNSNLIFDILNGKIVEGTAVVDWIFDLAGQHLDNELFQRLDKIIFDSIEQLEYVKFWKRGKAKIFPTNYIQSSLNDSYKNYEELQHYISEGIARKEDAANLLLSFLKKQLSVSDRAMFYKQLNHLRLLIQIDKEQLQQIRQLKNDFYEVILWFLGKGESFNFDLLKLKFIYFAPDDQIVIVRKLFSLKAKKEFDITIEKLRELTCFDLDLYKTNLKFNPAIPVDISTDVVIQALASYQQNKRFLVESELLKVVLTDLQNNQIMKFKLSNYFENCAGRQTAKFDWSREGEIRKIKFGNNQFYFAISFPAGETERVQNRWGGREFYRANANFDNLKDAVKKLPKAKWNPGEKHWGVPSQFESEVLSFAREYRFFLDFDGSSYANNTHLTKFEREHIPNGIVFCEGRLANRPHELFKKEFWWCAGKPCFEKCEHTHDADQWEHYTLLDFCEILQFNTDETNRMGDHIPKGIYYQFIALVNRFNRLLDKLYCRDCNQILHPVDTGHFAANTIVRFHCVNNNCHNRDEIYLNHCLNGQCNSIIDSRVSKRCGNGLFICANCGSCCSHEMLKRRLTNLRSTGGYVHENLIRCVEEKLGHLERAEYFCYKCSNPMDEISSDVFFCSLCDIKYDTRPYKFKRPHKYLRDQGNNAEHGEERSL